MELTMVKAQAYLKAGRTKKSAMLDDFSEGTGYCRRRAARSGAAPHGELVCSQSEAPPGERTGSHITKVYDTAQTSCARTLARLVERAEWLNLLVVAVQVVPKPMMSPATATNI